MSAVGDVDGSNNLSPVNQSNSDPSPPSQRITFSGDIEASKRKSKRLTNVESLINKIQTRRKNRLPVPTSSRIKFLDLCLQKAGDSEGAKRLTSSELGKLSDEYKNDSKLKEVFSLALKVTEEVDAQWFYFRDFNQYYLTTKPSFFGAHPIIFALIGLLLYYAFGIALFCGGMGEGNSTCPTLDSVSYNSGWLTAAYFASVTMSTVGYGDISVIDDGGQTKVLRVLIGVIFMVVSMVVAVTFFSSLSGYSMETLGLSASNDVTSPLLRPFLKKFETKSLLYRSRVTLYIRLIELFSYFMIVNVFGMLVARAMFALGKDDVDWNWMVTFYWAVQTTTTIGYGDLDMPENLKFFNLFFTIIGTTFLATILGALSSLQDDIANMRRLHSWQHREVSKRLIGDMEGNNDGKVDEYEFLVASLIQLQKISSDDVAKIMEKFKDLAGEDDLIGDNDIDHYNEESFSQRNSKRFSSKYLNEVDLQD